MWLDTFPAPPDSSLISGYPTLHITDLVEGDGSIT